MQSRHTHFQHADTDLLWKISMLNALVGIGPIENGAALRMVACARMSCNMLGLAGVALLCWLAGWLGCSFEFTTDHHIKTHVVEHDLREGVVVLPKNTRTTFKPEASSRPFRPILWRDVMASLVGISMTTFYVDLVVCTRRQICKRPPHAGAQCERSLTVLLLVLVDVHRNHKHTHFAQVR